MKNVEWRSVNTHKSEVEQVLQDKHTICVFDTETTGLEADAKIIQFSGILYNITDDLKFEPIKFYNTYLNPEMILPDIIVDLTGITQDVVDNAPTEKEKAFEIMNFLSSADVWAGQNINFDIAKVEAMCKRTNIVFSKIDSIDTLTMARHLISLNDIEAVSKSLGYSKANHKLGTITKYLFPNEDLQFHNSLDDVKATAMCLEKFISMYKERNIQDGKEKVIPKYASFWINPNKQSDQRIKICLPDNNKTAIYYDALKHHWTCYSTAADKKRFDELDKAFIEKCVLNRYSAKFPNVTCMEDLAREMRAAYTERSFNPGFNKSYEKPAPKEEPKQNEQKDAENDNEIELW